MNFAIEKEIVSRFVVDRKKERILYELSNRKKRDDCIWGLERYLDERHIADTYPNVTAGQAVYQSLKSCGMGDDCYVLSINEDVDGSEMKLCEALERVLFYGPALLYCPMSKMAYFEGEHNGETPRLLLK